LEVRKNRKTGRERRVMKGVPESALDRLGLWAGRPKFHLLLLLEERSSDNLFAGGDSLAISAFIFEIGSIGHFEMSPYKC
jgi:hypothetical protein